jgi:hypothetical protein
MSLSPLLPLSMCRVCCAVVDEKDHTTGAIQYIITKAVRIPLQHF